LVYHDCFGGFQCARLQVPLDWNAEEGTDNRTAEIALIKVPATVPVTDSRYGGAVVLNPGNSYRSATYNPTIGLLTREIGGPGGSGVSLVLTEVSVEESLY
jgi:hypothetical protein